MKIFVFSAQNEQFRLCLAEMRYFMEQIIINGGFPLRGSVEVSGMKNAALPIIFACILTKSQCTIENIPLISDVSLAIEILREMGASVHYISETSVEIDTSSLRC